MPRVSLLGLLLACSAFVHAVKWSSAARDPGAHDTTGRFHADQLLLGSEPMRNAVYRPNDGVMRSVYPDRPAPKKLADYSASWTLGERARTICLVVLDMENGYLDAIDFIIPTARALLDAFREAGQPVVWTNWARRVGDGFDGALDRFYGPRGTSGENPMYVYGPTATETVSELAPLPSEDSDRTIKSLHLSKFADVDEEGHEILDPMLRAWGVDTVVVVGSWTEDCILATVYDAVDRHGYDAVVVSDAVATGSPMQNKAIEVMAAAAAKVMNSSQLIAYMKAGQIRKPLARDSSQPSAAHAAALRRPDGAAHLGGGSSSVPIPVALAMAGVASLVSVLIAYRMGSRGSAVDCRAPPGATRSAFAWSARPRSSLPPPLV